jgi:hypothetical protein
LALPLASVPSAYIRTWLATIPDCMATSSNNVPATRAVTPTVPPRLPSASTATAAMTASRLTRLTTSGPWRSTRRPATGVHTMVAALTSASIPTAVVLMWYRGPVSRKATAVHTAEKPAKTIAW